MARFAVSGLMIRLRVQLRVLRALLMREMQTRFGRENLGFFWLMGEPLFLTCAVMVLWASWHPPLAGGLSIIPFVLCGYTLITLWRHIVARSQHCFRRNAGLMYHRNVHFLDTLIATALLEIAGTGLSFSIAYTTFFLFGYLDPIGDPLALVGGWLLSGWFSFGVGLTLAGLTEIFEISERFIQPLMYVSLPLSGLFYMVSWLPPKTAAIVLYSPQVNAMEMFRGGLLGHQFETHWDAFYLIKTNIVLTAFGLFVVHKSRKYISPK